MVKIFIKYWDVFVLQGIMYTLLLAAIAVLCGTVIGALLAFGRMSRFKVLRAIIIAFVEVMRGTPALLQLYVGYFLVPMLIPDMNTMPSQLMAFICVAVALTFNTAAYVSEIIRSGIEAVDKGQTEAARSLGLNNSTTMVSIVLPQAVKNILPALGNEFITDIKQTSLASTFFVGELMTSYKTVVGITYNSLSTLFVVGVLYFIMNLILSKGLKFAEKRMKAHA